MEQMSERAQEREVVREIETRVRKRFGEHCAFVVYIDTSDGDENNFDSCIHYVKPPPEARSYIMFPDGDRAFTAVTKLAALTLLRDALKGSQ